MNQIDVLHMTDPGCPWAYSASPALAVVRWRFGDQLRWTLSMIGLTEDAGQYTARGYTPLRQAVGRQSFRRFGMPLRLDVRERNQATARACRAVVATRLAHPDREYAVFRALQWGYMTTTRLMDTDEGIAASIADVPGIDARAVVGALDRPDVTAAYEADKARARTAAGTPCEAMGRTANSDGLVRYTAPSLVFTAPDDRTLDMGGFQPLEVYDAAIANLDPSLERRGEPEDPVEALAEFPDGLTTGEVAAILTPRNAPIDRQAAERLLLEALSEGRATRRSLGDDAIWYPV